MQTGENRALRWFVREGEPLPLPLYRLARRVERMTPDQLERLINGMDALIELREVTGVVGMSTQAALASGFLTEADVWGAFGMVPPERGPM